MYIVITHAQCSISKGWALILFFFACHIRACKLCTHIIVDHLPQASAFPSVNTVLIWLPVFRSEVHVISNVTKTIMAPGGAHQIF